MICERMAYFSERIGVLVKVRDEVSARAMVRCAVPVGNGPSDFRQR